MTRWVHFTRDGELLSIKKIEQLAVDPKHGSPYEKPRGLWVSDEDDYGWSEWCTAETFRLDHLAYAHPVTFKPDAKLLVLDSALAIGLFTDRYGIGTETTLRLAHLGGHAPAIDWQKVASEYHGILITPYCWALRLEHKTSWYYGWDCASGCVWDPAAIQSIGPPEPVVLTLKPSLDDVEEP